MTKYLIVATTSVVLLFDIISYVYDSSGSKLLNTIDTIFSDNIDETRFDPFTGFGNLTTVLKYEHHGNARTIEFAVQLIAFMINLSVIISVCLERYVTAWYIRNIIPFAVLYFPFGYVAFHSDISIKTTFSPYEIKCDGGFVCSIYEILQTITIYLSEHSDKINHLVDYVTEIVVRTIVTIDIVQLITGSLAVFIGIRKGISTHLESDHGYNDIMLKLMSNIIMVVNMAQLPVTLIIVGIMYQILPSIYVVLVAITMVLSKLFSHKIYITTVFDLLTLILLTIYLMLVNETMLDRFGIDLNIPVKYFRFMLLFIANYYLSVMTFRKIIDPTYNNFVELSWKLPHEDQVDSNEIEMTYSKSESEISEEIATSEKDNACLV